MRACTQCGLSIGDSATFCTVCGARVDSPVATAAAAPDAPAAQTDGSVDEQVAEQVAGQDAGAARGGGDAPSLRLHEAALPTHEAGECEKTDPARAAALYRDAILRYLEAAADPLDQGSVRHDLLFIFDRLSLVLKRQGLPAEALEEIDSAAALGLLDCQDRGITGHRDALTKRRESLLRSLDGESPQR